jgi:thioredoxin reductase (NADPH)
MTPHAGERGAAAVGHESMASPPADVNYTFSEAELRRLRAYGEIRRHEQGEMLVRFGDRRAECLVTISGEVHIFVDGPEGRRRLGWMEPGQFSGDITILTGHAALSETLMGVAGEVLHIPFESLQRLLVEDSPLSDVFVRTFTARRAFAESQANGAVIVLGTPYDPRLFAIRDFLARHSVPNTWLDPDADELAARLIDVKGIGADQMPAVVFGSSRVMVQPTANELADVLGLDLLPNDSSADVIVVGAGPAGLAAAVYAGSEGLTVLVLDAAGPGGQAGSSSKIENYLGFPTGLSGRELADRASIQALKFGVRMATPARAVRLDALADGCYCVRLEDGRQLRARSVVIAAGAQYRRLPLERLAEFEGRGIYYGASPLEAQMCSDSQVAVVGAGNSAGQGAVFLAQTAREVHVLYRRPDIRETMSEYLVRRLEEAPNIFLHPQSEIRALRGNDGERGAPPRLIGLTIEERGERSDLETAFAFLFIGAAPFTEWLPRDLVRDAKGFVLTGPHVDRSTSSWPLARPPTAYETSLPRVYAVGDIRAGSVKRVASAVGEGSVVVSDIHRALADLAANRVDVRPKAQALRSDVSSAPPIL